MTSGLEGVNNRRPAGPTGDPSGLHATCYTHRLVWRMTCQEYDDLREWAGHRCGICGEPDRYLNLDHDHRLGDWAIRGLLCVRCNPGVMRSVDRSWCAPDERVQRYLKRSWYLTHRLARAPKIVSKGTA